MNQQAIDEAREELLTKFDEIAKKLSPREHQQLCSDLGDEFNDRYNAAEFDEDEEDDGYDDGEELE